MSLFEVPQTVHYGLLFLTLLAEKKNGEILSLTEASEKLGVVSIEYLEQIVTPLRQRGLVTALRGRNGGYALTKPSQKITLADIVEILDGVPTLTHCQKNGVTCPLSGKCQSEVLWREVRRKIWETLQDMTLKDLSSALVTPPNLPLT